MNDSQGPDEYALLVKTRPEAGGVELMHRRMREPQPHEAVVKVSRAAICGTDLHIIGWNAWAKRAYRTPIALGHEFSGEVIALGEDVERVAIGDKVAAETHLACGACSQCEMGRGHTCLNLKVFSRLDEGAFSQYVTLPAQLLHVIPPEVPHKHACLMEPLGIAVRAVLESGAVGSRLLVSGCGPIGLLAVAAARELGVRTTVVTDLSESRRRLAIDLGALNAFDPMVESSEAQLRAFAPGGFDAVIEASGSALAIASTLPLLRPGGTLMLAGMPSQAVEIDLARDVILREVVLRGVYGRRLDDTWRTALELVGPMAGALDRIVTHEFELTEFDNAFATAMSGHAGKVQFLLS